jgi:very-short-patch-repair endonuclease
MNGLRFRRQHPIGPFIADFACLKEKLVIEVDGPSHGTDEGKAYDARRTHFFKRNGWREMRVSNMDVYENLEGALSHIARELNA